MNGTVGVNIKRRFIVVLPILLSGCGVGVNNLKHLPHHATAVGDEIALATDATIYDCEARDTFGSFWGSKTVMRKCLASTVDMNHYMHAVGNVPAGTKFTVSKIIYVNGIDNTWYEIFLRNDRYEDGFMVDDLFFPNLLNIPRR